MTGERSRRRLRVVQILVLSLLLTMGARLWYLQIASRETYQRAADHNRTRELATPALRGLILDDQGRALARNRTTLVVSADRAALLEQRDGGRALIAKVAAVLGQPVAKVWGRTRLCGEADAPKPPDCWNGSPYQPIPLSGESGTAAALQILERREEFPGITAEPRSVRSYPGPAGSNAAHELGYLGPVSEEDLAAQKAAGSVALSASELIGRAGLEKRYDADLRGSPGLDQVLVDHRGGVLSTTTKVASVPGNNLVTNIDARVQAVAERELLAAIRRARSTGDPNKHGKKYPADSGAVVVMDVNTGRIIAMASYPTYDPNIWVGGISTKEYAAITGAANNYPNQSRAFQGEFAPASTFKVISTPAAVRAGYSIKGTYPCPSSYLIGNTPKRNYESKGYGKLTFQRAIELSCDTVFYKFAYETWLREGGIRPAPGLRDPFTEMAKSYGLGRPTGIDLPGEAGGRIADRAWKRAYWSQTRDYYCNFTKRVPRRAQTPYLLQLARENCVDGWAYRGGDAANFAIGQGDTTVTPLQMAGVYSAIANGGTLWTPQIGRAIIASDGSLVREMKPRAAGRIPVDAATLAFLRGALRGVTDRGTGRAPFVQAGFPLAQIPVASKTGTGEVHGKETTSWFASYAPANRPQYAVVMMVSQGGTGSGTAGPGVANIYKALFGVHNGRLDPSRALLPGGRPPSAIPGVARGGRR